MFVASPNGRTIAGYYTLSQFAVRLDSVPPAIAHRLPKYPMVPATLVGRLAVAQEFRALGLGEFLLMDALHRSLALSEEIASVGVVVDALDESAAAFYRKYGFFELLAGDRRLFLPMGTISQLFS